MVSSHTNDGTIRVSLDTPASHAPLAGFPEPPAWIGDANCAGTDPEAFFPEKGGSARQAKAVCSRCTVQAECLDWALDGGERFGIYGGLSEHQRRKLRPPRTCPECGTAVSGPGVVHCPDHSPGDHPRGSNTLPGRVRDWARREGIPVNRVGQLPRPIVEDYLAVHPLDPANDSAIHDTTQETA